ncbi:Hsp20/alpha crystallin family protein [Pararobbsia alpina]|uniref:Hsp20/alpha crystallin family protein n=1 Tax=Pararobbsia alpina TaxID=621374 RepID=UPI0031B5655E
MRITAQLPGTNREDLHTSIEARALVLRGEKKQNVRREEGRCYRAERAYGAFMRTINRCRMVFDHVDAKFDRGVLTLKPAENRSVVISRQERRAQSVAPLCLRPPDTTAG